MPDIRLEHLTCRFGSTVAVNDITTVFPEGSATCLLGPSGCGKTTLLRMIAGLERPTAGRVFFGERDVTPLRAHQRDVAMVFQYPVMYRTLSVVENVELPLRSDRSLSAADRRARVEQVLGVLQLEAARDARMDELDVGTRQRVAVGRALARRCDLVLFDEPTTNVDVLAKQQLIRAFKDFRRQMRQTVIYVTHDQTEAMTVADQIALMQAGNITQCAAPQFLYDAPESEFGGWFLGMPGMNFINPSSERDRGVLFDAFPGPLAIPPGGAAGLRAGIRPEYVRVGPAGNGRSVAGRLLRRSITIGGQYLVVVKVGETVLRARASAEVARVLTDEVAVECPLEHVALFRNGVRLAVAPRRLGESS